MLLQFVVVLACLLTNIHAVNKLVALPVSVTSLFEAKNFYRNATVSFSFLNFTGMENPANLPSEQIELLESRQASFISYSNEFTTLIGYDAQLTLIEKRAPSVPFAHEGGGFIANVNEIWFTANQLPVQNTNISSINLFTNHINLLDIHPPIVTPNGLNYFNGYAYVCSQSTKSTPAGIYAVNLTTRTSRLVVNSWFGYRLNSPNDITFSTKIAE